MQMEPRPLQKVEHPEPWPAPPRRGRPRKSDALSEVIGVRVTPDEADSLYRLAQRHGQPLNIVLRRLLQRMIKRAES